MAYEEKLILNIDKAMNDFLADNCRYEITIRGQRLIIFDKKRHNDIVEMKFNEENRQEIQAKIEGICKSLNDGEIIIK